MRRRGVGNTNISPSFNTIIGGQGAITTTASALATLLGISAGNITSFNLNGNDIEAFINTNYSIPSNCFLNNTSITSFNDIDGNVTNISSQSFRGATNLITVTIESCTSVTGSDQFRSCTNLTYLYTNLTFSAPDYFCYQCLNLIQITFNSMTAIGQRSFQQCYDLTSLDVSQVTSIGILGMYRCESLTSITFPVCTSIGLQGLYQCTSLTSVTANSLLSISTSVFENCTALISFSSSSLQTIGASAFDNCLNMTTLSIPSTTSAGANAFYDCRKITSLIIQSCTSVGNQAFRNTYLLATLDIRSCTTIGSTVGLDNVFTNIKNGVVIYAHSSMQTINGGGVEGDLQSAITNNSATVNYI